MGRAADALVMTSTCPSPRSTIGGTTARQELVRSFDTARQNRPQVVDARLEEAADDDATGSCHRAVDATEPVETGLHQPRRCILVGEVGDAADHFDLRAQTLELFHQPGRGIADDEIMIAAGKEAGEVGPDIEAGVGHERDPSITGHRTSSPCSLHPPALKAAQCRRLSGIPRRGLVLGRGPLRPELAGHESSLCTTIVMHDDALRDQDCPPFQSPRYV